jgi:hypothetical protein
VCTPACCHPAACCGWPYFEVNIPADGDSGAVVLRSTCCLVSSQCNEHQHRPPMQSTPPRKCGVPGDGLQGTWAKYDWRDPRPSGAFLGVCLL